MTTTYRLPEKAGSLEVVPVGGCTEGCTNQVVVSPVGAPEIELTIAWKHLVKVPKPLPEEPARGVTVQVDASWVFSRNGGLDGTSEYWFEPGSGVGYTWAEVCAKGTPVRLIPAKFAESAPVGAGWQIFDGVAWQPVANSYPVTLPWTSEVYLGRRVTVNVLGGGPIISIEDADGTYPNTCHVNAGEMARALWTADAVRERAS